MIKASAVVSTPWTVPHDLLPDSLEIEICLTMAVKEWKTIAKSIGGHPGWPHWVVEDLIERVLDGVTVTHTEPITGVEEL